MNGSHSVVSLSVCAKQPVTIAVILYVGTFLCLSARAADAAGPCSRDASGYGL